MTFLALRQIEIASYASLTPPGSLGRPPKLEWLAIRDLVVDPEYQRDITNVGRTNVRRIALGFNWSMFAPVVVASAGSGKYAIVDGQHRTTAAAICGIDRVPCCIIEAKRGEQAAAFKAINGNVTKLSSMQLHHAALAAGEARAQNVAQICVRSGITILRYPKATNIIALGETMAVNVIARCIDKFGEETVVAALSSIKSAGGGIPGVLKAPIIYGTCEVLSDHPDWRGPRLKTAFVEIYPDAMFEDAVASAARIKGVSATDHYESQLVEQLQPHFKSKAA